MPLVTNSFRGGYTHTHTHTHVRTHMHTHAHTQTCIMTSHTKAISRNQVRTDQILQKLKNFGIKQNQTNVHT